MLYIVPTPIGNLEDISARAQKTLEACDFIIAENPLTTHKLLSLLKLPKKETVQFADHNELKVLEKITERLKTQTGCLVSDAGTPAISDPGFRLARACREQGIEVVSLPGASAFLTALAGSGLPTDKFLFVGFLPKTEPKLIRILEEVKNAEATLVSYESPQRILKTLAMVVSSFPESKVVVARELTKLHEEYITGTAEEVRSSLSARASIKGEIVLLISFK